MINLIVNLGKTVNLAISKAMSMREKVVIDFFELFL